MDLSVVVVNWNTREMLRDCLTSLRAELATAPLSAEVIVVDNASADGSADVVAREFPECTLIANAENRNYAGGNNQGLALARGEFVLLLNPDTVIPPGSLEKLVQILRDNPQAGAASPALIYPDGRLQTSVRGFPTPVALVGDMTGLGRLLPHSRWASYRGRDLPEDRASTVDQPMASAFLVRSSVLQLVGPFDEQFPLFFNDVDLCYRIVQAGWEILYEPRIRIVHVGGASTRQIRPQAILASHEGLRRYYAKHYRGRIFWPAYAAIVISIQITGRLRAWLASVRRSSCHRGT